MSNLIRLIRDAKEELELPWRNRRKSDVTA